MNEICKEALNKINNNIKDIEEIEKQIRCIIDKLVVETRDNFFDYYE